VGDRWRQRAVNREARPRTNVRRPERPSPRRRDHGDYHARAGRQEPDWLARRDHLSRRTHGSVPLAGRIDTWLVVGGSWLVVTPLITNYQTGSNRSSPAYATNHKPQSTNHELRTTNHEPEPGLDRLNCISVLIHLNNSARWTSRSTSPTAFRSTSRSSIKSDI